MLRSYVDRIDSFQLCFVLFVHHRADRVFGKKLLAQQLLFQSFSRWYNSVNAGDCTSSVPLDFPAKARLAAEAVFVVWANGIKS